MAKLETETNRFADPDIAYKRIVEAHRGLSDEESARFNARLVLILANHIGDMEVLSQALALAAASDGKRQGSGGDTGAR